MGTLNDDGGGNSSMQGYLQQADVHGMWTHTRSDSSALMALIGKCYAQIHGYVSVIVCVTSILVNLATVVVLTRRHMLSPSNTLLTGIAVTETLKLVAYGVYAYEFNLVTQIDSDVLYPLGWIYYLLVHASLSLVLYAIVTWLTVLLAVFRYIVVCVQHGQQKVTVRVARMAVMCVYVLCTTVYIPSYVSLYAVPSTLEVQERRALPSAMHSAMEHNDSAPLYMTVNVTLNGYTYGVHDSLLSAIKIIHGPVLKLLASVIITVPTTLLIIKMQQAARKRIILKGSSRRKAADARPRRAATLRARINNAASAISALPRRISSVRRSSQSAVKSDCTLVVVPPCEPLASVLHSNSNGETHLSDTSAMPSRSMFAPEISDVLGSERPRSMRYRHASQKGSQENHRRTTVLLLAVVMCFVVVEFPHGVMLLVGQLSEDFYHNVYTQLGDLLDLVALLSSSLNFVLYCTMSRQFRTTFADTFVAPVLRLLPCIRGRHLPGGSGSTTRIVYAHKRSNTKKSMPPCPNYVVVQPPTLLLDDDRCAESDKQKLVRLADERPALLSTNTCLGIPSHVSEISVSVFSGASSTSRTSQFSAVSHLSAFSAASQRSDGSCNSHPSAQSKSTTTTTTTTTTSTTADSVLLV